MRKPKSWIEVLSEAGSQAGKDLASAIVPGYGQYATYKRQSPSASQSAPSSLADEAQMRAEAARGTRDEADWAKAEGAANDLERAIYGKDASLSLTQADDALGMYDLTSTQREMARQMLDARVAEQSKQSAGATAQREAGLGAVAGNMYSTLKPSEWGSALASSQMTPAEREQVGQMLLQRAQDAGHSSEPDEPSAPQVGPGTEQYLASPGGQDRLRQADETMARMKAQREAARAEFERRLADQDDLKSRTFAPSGPRQPEQAMTMPASGPARPQEPLSVAPSGAALPPDVAANLELRRKQRMAAYEKALGIYGGSVR